MPAKLLRISGIVQGVFFRDGALKKATIIGLTGWIRNADDGAVEAHIEGDAVALDQMTAWCKKGPPAARVKKVEVKDVSEEGFAEFTITA